MMTGIVSAQWQDVEDVMLSLWLLPTAVSEAFQILQTFGYVLKAPRHTFPADIVRTGSITMATKGSWKF